MSVKPTPTRRMSKISSLGGNPLNDGMDLDDESEHIESIAGSHIIKPSAYRDIMDVLLTMTDNKARIAYVDKAKQGYLFSSQQLMEIVMITESLKTRIAFVESICPRITDPAAFPQKFVGLFRFEDDRAKVDDAFKARNETLRASAFNAGGADALGAGGRGGRGGANRGARPTITTSGRGGRGGGRGGRGRGGGASKPIAPRAAAVEEAAKTEDGKANVPPVNAEEPKGRRTSITIKSPIQRPGAHIAHHHHRSSVETIEEVKRRLAAEKKEADEELLEELSPEERKKRAEVKLVLASLGLDADSVQHVENSGMEAWERHASVFESNPARERGRTFSTDAPISTVPFAADNNATEPESEAKDASSPTPKPTLALATTSDSATSSAAVGTPGPTSTTTLESGHLPEKGSLQKLRAAFSSTSTLTPEAIPRVHSIFSPSRVSNSPANSMTPPPRLFSMQGSKACIEEYLDDGVMIKGVKYSTADVDSATRFCTVLDIELPVFLTLEAEPSLGLDANNVEMYSYQELLRRRFCKDLGSCDPKKLEQHLVDSEFVARLGVSKEEFAKMAAWKQKNAKLKTLLF